MSSTVEALHSIKLLLLGLDLLMLSVLFFKAELERRRLWFVMVLVLVEGLGVKRQKEERFERAIAMRNNCKERRIWH